MKIATKSTVTTWSKFIRNAKGQVAIFIALIFQVLFVFFAMIVNVGLVVHHKINLQNSVDIAAYYGATKQAEMMNAIGHVNYQIRQAFKLMTFRYRVLGGAGAVDQPNGFPYTENNLVREGDQPPPYETTFCVAYAPFDMVTQTESYCRKTGSLNVPLPGIPTIAGGFGLAAFNSGFQNVIANSATNFRNLARQSCKFYMGKNWMQLAKFILTYKEDIRNRRKLILGLANEVSQKTPKDLLGQSIKSGVYHTLVNNLSYPNRESLEPVYGTDGDGSATKQVEFKYLNSLAEGRCQGQPSADRAPDWIKEIYVYPSYAVTDGQCTGEHEISFDPSYLNAGGQIAPPANASSVDAPMASTLAQYASELSATQGDPQELYRTVIGYEKDPWCVAYTGVSAATTPKIPFTPLGEVTIKARAFAKPFGGRIGPWYGMNWPHDGKNGMHQSDDADPTDKLLPIRVQRDIVIPPGLPASQRQFANYSRYLGDSVGFYSDLTLSQFAKALRSIPSAQGISLEWWDRDGDDSFDQKNVNGDPLPWDKIKNQKPPVLRDLEIAAVAPDQFDTANYSIDPDFYNNYLTKIEKGYGNQFQFLLRGDLGSRMQGSPEEKRFSVRDQIDIVKGQSMIDQASKLTYYLNNFGKLLTSWQQVTPDQYVGVDSQRFGKCLSEVDPKGDENFFTMGSCKAGGRTGYSVKLVDGKFLENIVNGKSQVYQLGGPKAPPDKIDNPPTGF